MVPSAGGQLSWWALPRRWELAEGGAGGVPGVPQVDAVERALADLGGEVRDVGQFGPKGGGAVLGLEGEEAREAELLLEHPLLGPVASELHLDGIGPGVEQVGGLVGRKGGEEGE